MLNEMLTGGDFSPLPDWETAKPNLVPLLAPAAHTAETLPAVRPDDVLCAFVTAQIKMYFACICNGKAVPLTQNLIRQWAVSAAAVRLAIEENMSRIAENTRLERRRRDGFEYYSIQNGIPLFNTALLFFQPFQQALKQTFGGTFYAVAPELTTAVVFAQKYAPLYGKELRDDVLLTHDCSLHPLSTELLEVSEYGLVALGR